MLDCCFVLSQSWILCFYGRNLVQGTPRSETYCFLFRWSLYSQTGHRHIFFNSRGFVFNFYKAFFNNSPWQCLQLRVKLGNPLVYLSTVKKNFIFVLFYLLFSTLQILTISRKVWSGISVCCCIFVPFDLMFVKAKSNGIGKSDTTPKEASFSSSLMFSSFILSLNSMAFFMLNFDSVVKFLKIETIYLNKAYEGYPIEEQIGLSGVPSLWTLDNP